MSGPSDASTPRRRFEVRSILLWFQRNTIVALVLLLLLFVADRRAVEAGHGQSGVAVEHAPVRGAARHSRGGSDAW